MDDSFEDELGDRPLTPRERILPRDNLGLGEGYQTAQSTANDAALPKPTPLSPVRMGALDDAPTRSATSPSRPLALAQRGAPMSPPQAAAAAAATVAAAAATAAAEVARQSIELTRSREFESASEFVPHGTPLRDALVDAPEVPDFELDEELQIEFHGFGDHPARPDSGDVDENTSVTAGNLCTERTSASPGENEPVFETHFLRKESGNQPAVMRSIAGVFGARGDTGVSDYAFARDPAEEASRDAAFEEALERVRQSRRDIADKAAKGFSDMKAYYEAELRNAKVAGDDARHRTSPQPVPLSLVTRPRGFAWDLDEKALSSAVPTENDLARETALGGDGEFWVAAERVWPEPWRGTYSPPNEPRRAPFSLSESWSKTTDRAPPNPPDVPYPKEAAEAAAKRTEAVAAAVAAAAAAAAAAKTSRPAEAADPESAGSALGGKSSPRIRPRARADDANDDAKDDAKDEANEAFELAKRVKQLQSDLSAAERREKRAERAADDVELRREAVCAELKASKGEVQARDTEVRELGRALSLLKAQLDESKAEQVDVSRKLTSATSTIAKLTAEARDFANRVATLERENGALRVASDALKRECAGLKIGLGKATEDSQRFRERLMRETETNEAITREKARVSSEAETARRQVRGFEAKFERDSVAHSGVVASLQSAKREISEMRRRCEYLERTALMTGTVLREGVGRAVPGRGDVPAARPFSAAYRMADAENRAPANGSRGEDRLKRAPPRGASGTEDIPAAGIATRSSPSRASQGDHLGVGVVPELGSERREAFAAEYGDEHEGKDTRDHFGSGMDVHATFEGAAAAREMAFALRREQARARRDAEALRTRESEAIRAKPEASFAEEETARAETSAIAGERVSAGSRASEAGAFATSGTFLDAPSRYSAKEASRKGREGSGWFDALGETSFEPAKASGSRRASKTDSKPPPWLLGTETETATDGSATRRESSGRVTGFASASPASGSTFAPRNETVAPFATAESFATWSSHVAAAEARLMALSQEKDQLEGELSRMPEGSGKTIEQRRKKADAEKRLSEVVKASSAARHQLKAANKNLGNA